MTYPINPEKRMSEKFVKSKMSKFFHRIAHWIGVNKGNPDAFHRGNKLMMSFLCECGERSDIHPIDDVIDNIIKSKQ